MTVALERVYSLLKRMPLGDAIVTYLELELEFRGRTAVNVFEIALALEIDAKKMKTLANTLPLLVQGNRVIVQGSDVRLPISSLNTAQSQPDVSPESARDQPETSPNVARLQPEVSPTSGRAVPDDANAAPRVGVRGGFEFKPFAVEVKPTPNPKELKTPRTRDSSKPAKPAAEPKPPPEPAARDAMFDAIAVATYGGVEGLTPASCASIGQAKKQFHNAKYSPEDVLSIGDFLRERDPWRSQFTPRVLLEQAASWRNHDPKKPVQPSSGTAPNRSGKPVNFRPGADEIAATIRAGSRFFGGGQAAGNAPPTVNATSSNPPNALPSASSQSMTWLARCP